jgi:2-keto-4-pentenoate hydratase/2-oxohepta-3-ene-1,7-dioic acid hydratase in catechol pathway
MKLVSYTIAGIARFGAVVGSHDDAIVDLTDRLGPAIPTVGALIAADGLARASDIAAGASADHALSDVVLLPPVLAPQKIWCIGVNYAERNEEYKDSSAAPRYPSLFCRAPTSLVGHGTPIERPRVSAQLDYEGEIALLIGRPGRHISRADALSHVFGVTLCNEGSVRDWLRHGKFNVTQGKNFDRSGSLGPWIVTADTLDLASPLTLTTRVNGEVRQHDSTARLMFPFDHLIEYLSTFATLLPGDVIVTGTPTGAGAHLTPPRWLVPGDEVTVDVPGIGTLRNGVIDEL